MWSATTDSYHRHGVDAECIEQLDEVDGDVLQPPSGMPGRSTETRAVSHQDR
jgi:hypothetical protein